MFFFYPPPASTAMILSFNWGRGVRHVERFVSRVGWESGCIEPRHHRMDQS